MYICGSPTGVKPSPEKPEWRHLAFGERRIYCKGQQTPWEGGIRPSEDIMISLEGGITPFVGGLKGFADACKSFHIGALVLGVSEVLFGRDARLGADSSVPRHAGRTVHRIAAGPIGRHVVSQGQHECGWSSAAPAPTPLLSLLSRAE